jgi:transcriptional regulator with XRE-family HTH domain
MESLNQKLKRIRTSKNLSQAQIAQAAGISRAAYTFFENGTTDKLSVAAAVGIAKALNIPFNDLFDIPDKSEHLKKRIEELEQTISRHEGREYSIKEELRNRGKTIDNMNIKLHIIELFEMLDFDLFEKNHVRLLANLIRIETYSTDSVFWFLGEMKFKKLQEAENYLLPFLDIEKYAQSALLEHQLAIHYGSEKWTKETLIERVSKAKKRLDLE